jgi:hypothetical protein
MHQFNETLCHVKAQVFAVAYCQPRNQHELLPFDFVVVHDGILQFRPQHGTTREA